MFTDRQFGGNPLAVVLNGEDLSPQQMQSIAAEFNLSETTFVLPPQADKHTAKVRIFTPRAEMPFAGHPNVGTAFVLAREGASYGRVLDLDTIMFEEQAGLVRMDLLKSGKTAVGARLASPQALSIGADVSTEMIAEACFLPASAIVTRQHPPRIASCGTPFVLVEIENTDALACAQPRADVFERHFPRDRVTGIHLYTRTNGGMVDIHSRMFAPLHGVPEDPATGSANVALVGLLAQLQPGLDLRLEKKIAQGVEMGRPSILDAVAVKKHGTVVETYVGGTCALMMRGVLALER